MAQTEIDIYLPPPPTNKPTYLCHPQWSAEHGLIWTNASTHTLHWETEEDQDTYALPGLDTEPFVLLSRSRLKALFILDQESGPTSSFDLLTYTQPNHWFGVSVQGLWHLDLHRSGKPRWNLVLTFHLPNLPHTSVLSAATLCNHGNLYLATKTNPVSSGEGRVYRVPRIISRLTEAVVPQEYSHEPRQILGYQLSPWLTMPQGFSYTQQPPGIYLVDGSIQAIEWLTCNHVKSSPASPPLETTILCIPNHLGSPWDLTQDTKGFLYLPLWGGSAIAQVCPQTKRILHTFSLPAAYPTGVSFGGPRKDTLFITTANWQGAGENRTQPAEDMGGAIFTLTGM